MSAFSDLQTMIKDDPDYAWGWHCNIATPIYDSGVSHEKANHAAARIMRTIFGVDTSQHPNFRAQFNG